MQCLSVNILQNRQASVTCLFLGRDHGQLAVHRAVLVLYLLVTILTPALGLVIGHLALRMGVRAGYVLAGVTAFVTVRKYISNRINIFKRCFVISAINALSQSLRIFAN